MMRSLLCVGTPRNAEIDFAENDHGYGRNSREFAPPTAAGRMRTVGRRLSLQISSKLGGRSNTESANNSDDSGSGAGAKTRRNSKRASVGAISKMNIGHPEGFRHEQHVGFPGMTAAIAEVNLDLDNWREQIERSMEQKNASPSQTVHPPTQEGVRPKGPRPGSISRARPSNMDTPASTSTAQTGSLSQPNLHSSSQPSSAHQPYASVTSVASLPTNAGSGVGVGVGLSRSGSASAGGVNPPRRKPVPSHLPAMTEVSPFPTLLAAPQSAPGIPFSPTQRTQARDSSGPPPHVGGVQQDKAALGSRKELVPLLGVPEGRVAGHEAHYVTKTTKARWDGTISEIANALKDIDVRS